MCSLCGALGTRPHWSEAGAADQAARRSARAARTRYAAALLTTAGLRVREWQGQLVVSNGRGASVVVDDISACWAAAERLAGRPVDPLGSGAAEALARATA